MMTYYLLIAILLLWPVKISVKWAHQKDIDLLNAATAVIPGMVLWVVARFCLQEIADTLGATLVNTLQVLIPIVIAMLVARIVFRARLVAALSMTFFSFLLLTALLAIISFIFYIASLATDVDAGFLGEVNHAIISKLPFVASKPNRQEIATPQQKVDDESAQLESGLELQPEDFVELDNYLNATVRVRLRTRKFMRGQLLQVGSSEFKIMRIEDGKSSIKRIFFSQVRSITILPQ